MDALRHPWAAPTQSLIRNMGSCGGPPKLIAVGIAPLGILSIGGVPMGVVGAGLNPMGI